MQIGATETQGFQGAALSCSGLAVSGGGLEQLRFVPSPIEKASHSFTFLG